MGGRTGSGSGQDGGGPVVATATGDYPVLAEWRLAPVTARFPRRARRDPAELPPLEPGTVFVFEVDGEYRQPAVRRHLRGTEPEVVRAVAVSLIDVRPRLVPIELVIASGSAGYDLVVRATFRCRVIDAPAATAAGLRGVGELLAEHLGRDRELLRIGTYYDIAQLSPARTRIHTQVRAYCMVAPPQLPGLEVVLATVEVSALALDVFDDSYPTESGVDTPADADPLDEPCIDLFDAVPNSAVDTTVDIDSDDRGPGRGRDEDELVGGSTDW